MDVSLFSGWLDAYARDDQALADFYSDRFRDEFELAFDAWLLLKPRTTPSALSTPFALPQYQLTSQLEADRLEQEANDLMEKGKAANQQSDDYVFNTVILVSVLFFGGIAQRFKRPGARAFMIAFGAVMLIYGFYYIATYPVH